MIKPISMTFLLLIAFLSWQCSSEPKPEEKPVQTATISESKQNPITNYETLTAKPIDKEQRLNLIGRTQALEKIQLVAEVQGKVLASSKSLNEGVSYRKGETMIKIEDIRYRLELQSRKSQFQSALVRIMSQVQLDYPEAHPAWDQYLKAFDSSKILPELPEVTNDQLRYFLSANNIFSTYYNLKSAEELLPKYIIRAPFTGIITQGDLAAGAIVNPGVPLATYSRNDIFELKAAVSVAMIDRFKPGQRIQLVQNNTGKTYTGKVNRIGGAMDTGTQSVPVFIRVSGPGLREGMFLEAHLESDALKQVVSLPLDVLNRKNQVHVIQNSMVVLHDVTPVHYEKDIVWVTGLKGGEEIIIEKILEPIVGTKAISKSQSQLN